MLYVKVFKVKWDEVSKICKWFITPFSNENNIKKRKKKYYHRFSVRPDNWSSFDRAAAILSAS